MVNIGAIIYLGRDLKVYSFKNEHELISWKAVQNISESERDAWEYNYYHRTREREKRVEELFKITSGLLIGAHIIFGSQLAMELHVARREVLEAIHDTSHVIVLEIRSHPFRKVATFYVKDHQFSLIIEMGDPPVEEDVQRRVGREGRIPRLD